MNDKNSQTMIEEKTTSSTQMEDDLLVKDLKNDLQALVKVIQTAINEKRWDLFNLQLATIDIKDVLKQNIIGESNLRAGLTKKDETNKLIIEKNNPNKELNEVNDRVRTLQTDLNRLKNENQTLIEEMSNLKMKMDEKEKEYHQAEKVKFILK